MEQALETDTWLDHLNPAQRESVCLPMDRHGAILAGAGTGKTNVLTHRIAYAIRSQIDPETIVAVTFTNKAAAEMRQRVQSLVGEEAAEKIRMGTFHSLCLKIIRRYGGYLGLDRFETITPMDEDESTALLRRVMKEGFPELNLKIEKPRAHYATISRWKDHGLYVEDVPQQKTERLQLSRKLYAAYEREKKRSQTVDFPDLIMMSNLIFRQHKELAEVFQNRLRMVLVDEFQDTNPTQIEFIAHITGKGQRVPTFVVGDDDQSIYGFRGAQSSIMQTFLDEYSPNHLVRLEQNYRCTSTILDGANKVIANNEQRIGKNLWTERQDVGHFHFTVYDDGDQEARAVAEQIESLVHQQGVSPADIAVLYRKNTLSMSIEKGLVLRNIPYRVYGGLNFFQRREIKDALAWLRVVLDPLDEMAVVRAISVPKRGVGPKTLEDWRNAARSDKRSLWSIIQDSPKKDTQDFVRTVKHLRHLYEEKGLVSLADAAVYQTGLANFYITTAKERGEECVENLKELITTVSMFNHEMRAAGNKSESLANTPGDMLSEFLSEAVMNSDSRSGKNRQKHTVSLMTVHRAKGLEFPYVFLIGLEDGEFPKITDHGFCDIEEERRIFYVGMTRSKLSLFLSCAKYRRSFDNKKQNSYEEDEPDTSSHLPDDIVSRFVREIPKHLLGEPISPFRLEDRSRTSRFLGTVSFNDTLDQDGKVLENKQDIW